MDVTVRVAGEGETTAVSVPEDGSYRAVLEAMDLHPQTAAVLVEDRPVPLDEPVSAEAVTVVRLITGG